MCVIVATRRPAGADLPGAVAAVSARLAGARR
jgi:hypothetical protein